MYESIFSRTLTDTIILCAWSFVSSLFVMLIIAAFLVEDGDKVMLLLSSEEGACMFFLTFPDLLPQSHFPLIGDDQIGQNRTLRWCTSSSV